MTDKYLDSRIRLARYRKTVRAACSLRAVIDLLGGTVEDVLEDVFRMELARMRERMLEIAESVEAQQEEMEGGRKEDKND